MRKYTKLMFYYAFTPLTNYPILETKRVEVFDGRYLFHKVHWDRNERFSAIFKEYVRCVLHDHSGNVVVVFDDYPQHIKNYKSAEKARRLKIRAFVEVQVNDTMLAQMLQEKLLGNAKNKVVFISILQNEFEEVRLITKQANEDAYVLILNTVIFLAPDYNAVIVKGEDLHFIVLVDFLAPGNVYLRKAGRGRKV